MPYETHTKRHFLRLLAAGFSLAATPAMAFTQRSTPAILKRAIPSTGELLPILGFGTSRVFDVNKAEGKRKPLRQALKLLFDAGGSVIDTAHNYNRAEEVAGDLLMGLGLTKNAFLSTKVYASNAEEARKQFTLSQKRLRKHTLDLYFIHNLVGLHRHYSWLQSQKEAGLIRYIGFSHYSASGIDAIITAIETGLKPDFVQIPYSLALRHSEKRLLPLAADQGIAVIANQPFAKGSLFRATANKKLPQWAQETGIGSWAQFFLKYITSNPQVHCVIPGTGNPVHAADNIQAGSGYQPSHEEREKMAHFWDTLSS